MNELTTTSPFQLTSFESVEKMAGYIADAGLYGIKKPSQAITLMMLAHEQQKTMSQLLKEIHVFEDGKIAQRADFTQGSFEQSGIIIWHVRADDMCAASFFREKAMADDIGRARAIDRFKKLWALEFEKDGAKRSKLIVEIADLSRDGETTIIRTLADAEAKGITEGKNGMKTNWKTSPRQMLSARVITEGVKVVDPIRAPLPSEDEVRDIQYGERQEREQFVQQAIDDTPATADNIEALQKEYEAIQVKIGAASPKEREQLYALRTALQIKIENYEAEQMHLKTKTVDATDAVVEPPQKEATPPPAMPASKPTLPAESFSGPWQDYTIQHIKVAAYKGRKLSEFDKPTIEVLHKKRCLPYLKSEDAGLRAEAEAIKEAFDAWSMPGSEG